MFGPVLINQHFSNILADDEYLQNKESTYQHNQRQDHTEDEHNHLVGRPCHHRISRSEQNT